MIRNVDLDGINLVFNEDYEFEKDFLKNEMLIYKLSFPDGYFYIGKTSRSLIERMNEHIYGDLKVDKKIREYKGVKITIIDFASDVNKLSDLEKKYICSNNYNRKILNEVLYRG